ncbi:PREDICTED: mitochondrial sodium/hydrogen exchanger 9B2 isoform X3 [Mandrillus leucophaeus]|uniref:Solute carrier family 9 member B2 n=1 Tax=Mandrillus leucophaeus TaxID=9568 RepID=A0A2K5ZZB5_MANLE|nr:PREDICTED: mitochondrial sodium/hydrogen exchanger 9B2 isoform X3 [Mandrillus leucophaeus]
MGDEDKRITCEDSEPSTGMNHMPSMLQETQEETVMNLKGIDANEPTEGSILLKSSEKKLQETPTEANHVQRLRQMLACPPHGLLDRVITNGMLLAGFLIRNIPVVNDNVQIKHKWSSSLRSIALSIILVRAGLGLDSKALKKLKGVCVRLSMGPCIVEACTSALLAHYLLGLPWQWGFILGFVLGAVSPAVVVPSMLLLQGGGYGVEKGVPTLLMAAGSFDDILAITGFNTCLGIAFSTGSTVFNVLRGVLEVVIGVATGSVLGFFIQYFPSRDQDKLVCKRTFLVLGLSVLAVFSSVHFGFPGSGGLCTLVMAFLAGMGWTSEKAEVEKIIAVAWDIFQPLLFGLIGAEVSIASLRPETVGCNRICGFGHSKVAWRETIRRLRNGCVDSGIFVHPYHSPNWKSAYWFTGPQAFAES